MSPAAGTLRTMNKTAAITTAAPAEITASVLVPAVTNFPS
jgi:hypothetical protein